MPENSVGALTSRLSSDCTFIKTRMGEPIQQSVMTLFSVGMGITIGFILSWQLALLQMGTLPFMGAALGLQTAILQGQRGSGNKDDGEAGAIVGETISSIRTVMSAGLGETLITRYRKMTSGSLDNLASNSFRNGMAFGLSVSVQHLNTALLFYFGGWLVDNEGLSFDNFYACTLAVTFGTFGLGAASANLSSADEARRAFNNVFTLLDRQTKIDPVLETGDKPSTIAGALAMKNVNFTYPSRPETMVCKGYSLDIKPGMTVGLVGPSGSGKSTAIALFERFYDADAGTIQLDSKSLSDLNYKWLHSTVAYVGQEPVLFSGTIGENICMGAKEELTLEGMLKVSHMANAHEFIMKQPEGYSTNIGIGGGLLSGGQKQRVAIARALASEPTVLLLDEATSALDSQSEKVVQDALDTLIQESGMTTVMIAHRLTTVRDCDMICVVKKGKIVEHGKHDELMDMKGLYYDLANASSK
jgi:ATP-binding cassette subfamily B (MDR/TAP) protein 1